MNGRGRRSKGQVGERELAKILESMTGYECSRNLDQVRFGGADILTLPGLAIEVKRQEVLKITDWWLQACRQAAKSNLIPVLGYRQSRQPWRLCVPFIVNPNITGIKKGPTPYMTLNLDVFELWLMDRPLNN